MWDTYLILGDKECYGKLLDVPQNSTYKSRNIYLFIYSFSYIWHFSLKLLTNIFIYVFLLHVSTKRYTFLLVGVFRYHQNKNEAPQISTPDLTKTCEYIESLAKICNEPRLTKLRYNTPGYT